MDTLITAIIFIVIIVLSITQKIKERRALSETQRRKSKPNEMPKPARQTTYGEPGVREAKPKGAPPPRQHEAVPAKDGNGSNDGHIKVFVPVLGTDLFPRQLGGAIFFLGRGRRLIGHRIEGGHTENGAG